MPPPADTTGWRTLRWTGVGDERHLLCRIPAEFRRDSTEDLKPGATVWVDGARQLTVSSGYGWDPGPKAPGTFECADTLAGRSFVILTSHGLSDSLYHVAASHVETGSPSQGEVSDGLSFTSKDSADQRLFLAIVRTIREETWVARSGVLFLGGNELRPPYVLTRQGERLTVNGRRLPDLVPPSARQPAPNAELEARRSLEARLIALRDSLLAIRMGWPEAQDRMKAAALTSPVVRSVQLLREGPGMLRFSIHYGFGFNRTILMRTGPAIQMSSREHAFAEDNHLWYSRMDYLKSLLDDGAAVFLLGGGREYVVPPDHAAAAREAARGAAKSPRAAARPGLLPADVLDQMRSPLALVPAGSAITFAASAGAGPGP